MQLANLLSCQCCKGVDELTVRKSYTHDAAPGLSMDVLQLRFDDLDAPKVEELDTWSDEQAREQFPSDGLPLAEMLYGPGASRARPEEPFRDFVAVIDRSAGKKMGMGVRQDHEMSALQVVVVEKGDTAVSVWNNEHPGEEVKEGDYIIQVNSKRRDIPEMVDECMKTEVLHVKLRRIGVPRDTLDTSGDPGSGAASQP